MIGEETARFSRISGEDVNDVSIIRIGAYLDGYDKAIEDLRARCYEWNQKSHKRIPYKAILDITEGMKR